MTTFLSLTDTPDSFIKNRRDKVNNAENALIWGNVIYVDPPSGSDQVSSVISGMSDGDVVVLDKGTYTQTAPLSIPSGVKRFSIIGYGMNQTRIDFQNCDGIKQANTDEELEYVLIRGFTITTNQTGTKTGISLRGKDTNQNDYPGHNDYTKRY